jgi:hypothetical protein
MLIVSDSEASIRVGTPEVTVANMGDTSGTHPGMDFAERRVCVDTFDSATLFVP